MKPEPAALCVCGSGRPADDCCARFHAGEAAPTPEALMRSRYSAFVLDRRDYLLDTWHPDTRPQDLPPPEPGLRWLGLEVKAHVLSDADHGTVEFVARSKIAGRAHRLHETSRFVRENGLWYYLDGDFAR
ncbi:MAG: hypothetical protein GY848_18755 [Methyloversatilis sp.]|nr:hypothetical protein [Methyloversatilis sp.]